MAKVNDRIMLGAISGIVAAWPPRLLNALQYKLGLTELRYDQIASPLFVTKNKTNTPGAIALGEIINIMNTGAVGVLTTYILSLTGRDKAIIKGIGVGTMSWVFINGLIAGLGLKIKTKKPLTPILAFLDHALGGALIGLLISKYGDDSLFPDANIRKQDKIPVVFTGTAQNVSIDKEKN